MIHGLIPAAGLSSRMGQSKLALPFRGKTLLETVVDNLLHGGCDHVTVVLGPTGAEWVERLASTNVDAFPLEIQTPDMRSTVESGLARIEAQFAPADRLAFLLCPADCPLAASAVVSQLSAKFRSEQNSALSPNYRGKRGHPILLAWKHVEGIRGLSPDLGINSYLRQIPQEIVDVLVDEPGILADIDTPADYRKIIEGRKEICISEDSVLG